MVTKVRGSFTEFEGTAVVGRRPRPVQRRGHDQAVDSIDTRNEQRDGHLRSNDFLDIESYPEITFVSTSVVARGPRVRGHDRRPDHQGRHQVGHDHVRVHQGTATDPFGNERVGFEGSVVINRKDWGVNWNAALETGGVLVSEKVTLEFDISAIKSA